MTAARASSQLRSENRKGRLRAIDCLRAGGGAARVELRNGPTAYLLLTVIDSSSNGGLGLALGGHEKQRREGLIALDPGQARAWFVQHVFCFKCVAAANAVREGGDGRDGDPRWGDGWCGVMRGKNENDGRETAPGPARRCAVLCCVQLTPVDLAATAPQTVEAERARRTDGASKRKHAASTTPQFGSAQIMRLKSRRDVATLLAAAMHVAVLGSAVVSFSPAAQDGFKSAQKQARQHRMASVCMLSVRAPVLRHDPPAAGPPRSLQFCASARREENTKIFRPEEDWWSRSIPPVPAERRVVPWISRAACC